MSAQAAANSLVKTQIQINFAAPALLNSDVLGSDSDIGLTAFNLLSPNIITNIEHALDPAAGVTYTLFTRRLNFVRAALGRTPNFLTTFTGERRSGMPRALKAGFVQFVEQQNTGALTAQNYIITTQLPLSI